jgi:alpha-L-fucosidase
MLDRSREMPAWYEDGKLGIFIHWGLPSVPGFATGPPLRPGELEAILLGDADRPEMPYSEWYLSAMQLPGSETAVYHARHYGADAPYDIFQPLFERNVTSWQPGEWAELFERFGARYVVLVAKHHDGWTLWPSSVENPRKPGWQSSRDLVGQLATAVRERGMRFGTYYSTGLDWTFELATGDDQITNLMRSAPPGQDYADYVHDHLRELIDRYSPDVMWADIGYPSRGRLDDLLAYYYQQVPEGVVNDRWIPVDVVARIARWPGGAWLLKTLARWQLSQLESDLVDDPARFGFKTAEYTDLSGIAPFKWESTRGLGGSFGFNRTETAEVMLTGEELVHYLADVVAKNGNLLINVGPDSYGRIPVIQRAPLSVLGDWLAVNGEAIYGTRPWSRFGDPAGEGPELRFTRTDEAVYVIVLGELPSTLTMDPAGEAVSRAALLGGGTLPVETEGGRLRVDMSAVGELDSPAPVVKLYRGGP